MHEERYREAVPRSFIDLSNTFLEIKFAEAMKSRGKDAEAWSSAALIWSNITIMSGLVATNARQRQDVASERAYRN